MNSFNRRCQEQVFKKNILRQKVETETETLFLILATLEEETLHTRGSHRTKSGRCNYLFSFYEKERVKG